MTTEPQSPVAVVPPPPNRRNTELVLLCLAAVLAAVALLNVELNQDRALGPNIITFPLAFLVLFGAAHLAVRRFAPHADPVLLPVVTAINGLGLVLIHRLDLGDPTANPTAGHQLLWTAIGLTGFVVVLGHWDLRPPARSAG